MLSLVRRGKLFHIDATYKIVKNAYPLIVLEDTDADHVFFPVCQSHETHDDYVHFLTSFVDICKKAIEFAFEPEFIMSDADKMIHSVIDQVLPQSTKLMCSFHVRMNVRLIV